MKNPDCIYNGTAYRTMQFNFKKIVDNANITDEDQENGYIDESKITEGLKKLIRFDNNYVSWSRDLRCIQDSFFD